MPEVTGHAVGRPSWAELASPDVKASRDFYCSLFGWYVYTLTVPEYDDYEIFTLGGVQGPEVAGMQRLADEAQPPSWSVYFRTDDVPATVEAVKAAGGQELVSPMRVADLGMHVHLLLDGARIPAVMPALEASGARIVIDHFGNPDVGLGMNDPGFQAILRLIGTGRTWVKVSGSFHFGDPAGPRAWTQKLLEVGGPERLIWGSDCPFVGSEGKVFYPDVIRHYYDLVPDPAIRADLVLGLARAAGPGGMVGGQMLDLAAEGRYGETRLGDSDVRRLQAMKTGAVLAFSVEAGALVGRADPPAES